MKTKSIYFKIVSPCECRKVNTAQYKDYFVKNGHQLVDDASQADEVVVWTCGFRKDYLDISKETIKALGNINSNVVITGCLPDIDSKYKRETNHIVIEWKNEIEKMDERFFNGVKLKDIGKQYAVEKKIDDLAKFRKENPGKDATFSDQFIKLFVSEGCELNCTYCSERLMFPKQVSFPEQELLDQVAAILENSHDERKVIILQGDNPGAYGTDIGTNLPALIRKILALDDAVYVGVANLNPIYFIRHFNNFIELIDNGRLAHMRLPVQSGSDRILGIMKRGYKMVDVIRVFDAMRGRGYTDYSTDIIVGFPSETEDEFLSSVEFVKEYRPTYVNLSRYMDLEAIKASHFPGQIAADEKESRIRFAEREFQALNIFCNTDGGEHAGRRQDIMKMI